jgi:hypothetical protein
MVARHDGTGAVLVLLRFSFVICAERRRTEEKAGNRQSKRSSHGVLQMPIRRYSQAQRGCQAATGLFSEAPVGSGDGIESC